MSRAVRVVVAAVVALSALGGAVSLAAYAPGGALRSASRATSAPAADSARPGWLCRAQRDAMGREAFNQLWAGAPHARNGMGKCVTAMAEAKSVGRAGDVEQSVMAAVRSCRVSRHSNPGSFRRRFGRSTKTSNALGKCVRARTNWQGVRR
jgi:hypothetical protein